MKNKVPVYIVDRLVIGNNHIMFNTAITAVLAELYKDRDVIFIAENNHAKEIKKTNFLLTNLSIQPFKEERLPSAKIKKIYPWLRKKLGDILAIKNLYRKTDKQQDPVIFFTCLSMSSYFFANILLKKYRNQRVYFFLHGEIEYIYKRNIGIINRLKGYIFKITLSNLNKNAKCIVLSPFIEKILINNKLFSSDQILSIEHPMIAEKIIPTSLNKNKIVFAHLGVALKNKSSEIFFDLARSFKSEINTGHADFYLAGKIDITLSNIEYGPVNILSVNNKAIPQADYIKHIQEIDYTLFTFNNHNYILRSSGTIIDSIYFCKPIIALKHDYLTFLFSVGGNIGFLCDTIEQMHIIISRLIQRDPELTMQYSEQQNNISLLQKRHSIQEIKEMLKIKLNINPNQINHQQIIE